MPVLRQSRIYRSDLRANPSVLYLFGDNELRVGLGGQAAEMRGEPNAIGVCTKATPGGPNEYWTDRRFDECCLVIDTDLAPAARHASTGCIIVVPLDGLGTGLAELDKRAPKVFKHLTARLEELARVTTRQT